MICHVCVCLFLQANPPSLPDFGTYCMGEQLDVCLRKNTKVLLENAENQSFWIHKVLQKICVEIYIKGIK